MYRSKHGSDTIKFESFCHFLNQFQIIKFMYTSLKEMRQLSGFGSKQDKELVR